MNKEQFKTKMIGSPIIRICSYPYIKLKHALCAKEYINLKEGERIRVFRNRYNRKRCFVVGNGPSLKMNDLKLLYENHEICFGMNHIYDLFSKTEWRPEFYFCFDRDFIRTTYEKIVNLPINNIFIEYSKTPKSRVSKNNVYYFFSDYVFALKRGTAITNYVCEEVDKRCSFVTNTTHLCIEFAIYMGFKEIYLIGMDHDYSFGYDKNHAEGIKEAEYNDKKLFVTSDMDVSTRKFEQYRKYAEEHNIQIYNVSHGGKLEVFERKDLNSLFLRRNGNV